MTRIFFKLSVKAKKKNMDSRVRGNDKEKQIRNPNIEIRNNIECSKFKFSKKKNGFPPSRE